MVKKELCEITGNNKVIGEMEDKRAVIADIREALKQTADIEGKFIDESLVDQVVERVVPYEDFTFKWYLNIGVEPPDTFELLPVISQSSFLTTESLSVISSLFTK